MIEQKTLSNNIILITEKNEMAKTSSIGFFFNVGSRNEKMGEYGITHFTEHMIFKGTKKFTTHEISRSFDRIGGYVNAFTERECVCAFSTVPTFDGSNGNFKTAVDVLCSMASEAVFPEDEMEKERSVVENEILSVLDDVEECALDYVAQCVWPSSSLSRQIGGSVDDVEKITREQMVSWYEEYFARGELSVFAAGNIDRDYLEEKLLELGEHKKCICYPEVHYNENLKFQSGRYYKKSSFMQSEVYALYPFDMPLEPKSNYVLSVFNAIAGDSMSSRLFESLRERNGLCYSVYSFVNMYEDQAAWCAFVSAEKKKTVQVVELLEKEIQDFLSVPVTDEELEDAKQHVCGEEIMGGEDMEYVMKRLQRNFSLGMPLETTEQILESVQNVTKNDIMELAKKLLDEQSKAVVVYGPGLSLKEKKSVLSRKY